GGDRGARRDAGSRPQARGRLRRVARLPPVARGKPGDGTGARARVVGSVGPGGIRPAVAGTAPARGTHGTEGSVSGRPARSGPAAGGPARPQLLAAAARR